MEEFRSIKGGEVIHMLNEVAARRLPVQMEVDSEPPQCMTRIHDIRPSRKQIYVYTFGEGEVDRRMEPGARVESTFLLEELPYRFISHCMDGDEGIHYHCLEVPTEIQEIQRRAFFRSNPPHGRAVQVVVRYDADGALYPVETLNMSVGGLLIHDRKCVEPPEVNQVIKLQLRFENGMKMVFGGRVRHVVKAPPGQLGFRIGMRFLAVTPREELTLSQTIMRWQRELRRDRIDG